MTVAQLRALEHLGSAALVWLDTVDRTLLADARTVKALDAHLLVEVLRMQESLVAIQSQAEQALRRGLAEGIVG